MAQKNAFDSYSAELQALAAATKPTAPAKTRGADLEKTIASAERRLERFRREIIQPRSKARIVSIDMGGNVVAQASTELINWGIRALGRWSNDGWIANNVDLLQGLPHFILGLGTYILEMATRRTEKDGIATIPSATREVISEASKLFSNLGFANVSRALRVRFSDMSKADLDLKAMRAEKVAMQARINQLEANKSK